MRRPGALVGTGRGAAGAAGWHADVFLRLQEELMPLAPDGGRGIGNTRGTPASCFRSAESICEAGLFRRPRDPPVPTRPLSPVPPAVAVRSVRFHLSVTAGVCFYFYAESGEASGPLLHGDRSGCRPGGCKGFGLCDAAVPGADHSTRRHRQLRPGRFCSSTSSSNCPGNVSLKL